MSEFARAFSGLVRGATPAEHMFREGVVKEKRRAWLWLVPVAVGFAAIASVRPNVRESVLRFWNADWTSAEFWHGNVEMSSKPATDVGMPSGVDRAPTRRTNGGGASSDTRTGGSTVRGGDGKTVVGGPVNPGPSIDPYPRLPQQSNTQVADASPRAADRNSQGSSAPANARAAKTNASPAVNLAGDQRSERATAPASEAIGSLEVSISGAGAADVYIDGLNRGKAPVTWQGSPGKHIVALRPATAFKPAVMEVTIARGTTTRAVFTRR